jgi:tripartite-type tricarboxylate transporter receptor subunit TctC
VFRSEPDGYTLLVVPPSFVTNPFVLKNTGWTASEWSPISIMATAPYVLLARPGFQGVNVKDLIDQARSKPGVVSYASGGVGSSSHLSGVQLETLAGIKMAHVPYRGATPALNDIMAGHVDVVFDALVTALPFWQGGKVKALALGSTARAPVMRDVPTIAESGVPDFEAGSWAAILAPPLTPSPIVEKLSGAVREILKEPAVAQRIRSLQMELLALDPDQSAKFIAKESAHWERIVRKAGITPQ